MRFHGQMMHLIINFYHGHLDVSCKNKVCIIQYISELSNWHERWTRTAVFFFETVDFCERRRLERHAVIHSTAGLINKLLWLFVPFVYLSTALAFSSVTVNLALLLPRAVLRPRGHRVSRCWWLWGASDVPNQLINTLPFTLPFIPKNAWFNSKPI